MRSIAGMPDGIALWILLAHVDKLIYSFTSGHGTIAENLAVNNHGEPVAVWVSTRAFCKFLTLWYSVRLTDN